MTLSPAQLELLAELSATRGRMRIGKRGRALAALEDACLVEVAVWDARRPEWRLTAAGRAELRRWQAARARETKRSRQLRRVAMMGLAGRA